MFPLSYDDIHVSANLRIAAPNVCQPDAVLEGRRVRAAGQLSTALAIRSYFKVRSGDSTIPNLDRHHSALGSLDFLPLQSVTSDELVGTEFHGPTEPCFQWCRGIVDIVAVQHETGFQSQRVACSQADRFEALRLPTLEQPLPDAPRIIGTHVQLEAILSGVASARDNSARAGHPTRDSLEVSDPGQVHARMRLQKTFGPRTLNGNKSQVFAYILDADAGWEVRPHPVEILFDVGCVYDQHQVVLESIH